MPSYSNERREAVVAKLLPPRNLPVREVAQQEGISEPTVYRKDKRPFQGGATAYPPVEIGTSGPLPPEILLHSVIAHRQSLPRPRHFRRAASRCPAVCLQGTASGVERGRWRQSNRTAHRAHWPSRGCGSQR